MGRPHREQARNMSHPAADSSTENRRRTINLLNKLTHAFKRMAACKQFGLRNTFIIVMWKGDAYDQQINQRYGKTQ